MMMEALEAGGLEAGYDTSRNETMNSRFGDLDYVPNDNYYELTAQDYVRSDLIERFDGKLIKCLVGGVLKMPVGEYRVAFMRRPAAEIKMSLTAFFGSDTAASRHGDLDSMLNSSIELLRDRRSFLSVDVIDYQDAVLYPLPVFERLVESGWPIDPVKAARIPTPQKARYVNA